jgi:SAM-dependent methyltransferase
MLAEHLDQSHGAASRPFATIDAHVAWLHAEILGRRPSRVLDLGCGPGLYTARLASLGHSCVGVDIAPAAIDFARNEAARYGADCRYVLADVRTADLGSGYGLVTFLFGDLDTMAPGDAAAVLSRAAAALAPGGRLVLEAHTSEAVRRIGSIPPGRSEHETGLFADGPHRLDFDAWWYPRTATAIRRFQVLPASGPLEEYVVTTQSRAGEVYPSLLAAAGLDPPEYHAGFGPVVDPDFTVLVARRR